MIRRALYAIRPWCEARHADFPWRGRCYRRRGHVGAHENHGQLVWLDDGRFLDACDQIRVP